MPAKPLLRVTDGTFAAVLREYRKYIEGLPPERMADSTKANYGRILDWAEAVLGKYSTLDPVNGIRPKLVQAALDTLADRPGAQTMARALLSNVDKWAAPRELLLRAITFGTEVVGSEGGHTPWSNPQVDYGEKNARVDLSRVITLMAHLGQRGSDVVRMRLPDMEEHPHPITGRMYPGINVMQQKTGLRLWVPFTEELVETVREWKREIGPPWLLVTKQLTRKQGEPYTRPQLSWHWNDQRENDPALAPLKEAGMVLHGLRGTCVVRYRKAGSSVLEICSTVGMSEPMVTRYCRFADRTDLALAAVHRLSPRTGTERKLSDQTGK